MNKELKDLKNIKKDTESKIVNGDENIKEMDLVFVLDKSGSMYRFVEDTIGGYNSLIEEEKSKNRNTNVTTILFDHEYDVLYERKDIKEVPVLTENEYSVRGSTALYDAIGKAILSLDNTLNSKVLFTIITDGKENSSIEFNKSSVKDLIEKQDWEFVFIGADIDSYSESSKIGIKKSCTANFTKSKKGVRNLYKTCNSLIDYSYADVKLDKVDWKKELEEGL